MCFSIESGRRFATAVIALGFDNSIDSLSAGMALRSGSLATGDIVEEERDRLLEKLNRFKVENKQSMNLIFERMLR